MHALSASFYDRDVVDVARDLLGQVLVGDDGALRGRIVETEAYHSREAAAHSFGGPTPRTEHLHGAPGTLYVYFTYGMHWCANAVCEGGGVGAAVLLRAVEPVQGLDVMRQRRAGQAGREVPDRLLCSGPARLAQAFGIDGVANGTSLVDGAGPLAIIAADGVADTDVVVGPRIGITRAVELPWRFGVAGSRFLSRSFPSAD